MTEYKLWLVARFEELDVDEDPGDMRTTWLHAIERTWTTVEREDVSPRGVSQELPFSLILSFLTGKNQDLVDRLLHRTKYHTKCLILPGCCKQKLGNRFGISEQMIVQLTIGQSGSRSSFFWPFFLTQRLMFSSQKLSNILIQITWCLGKRVRVLSVRGDNTMEDASLWEREDVSARKEVFLEGFFNFHF
jgi:hypothetical protein